MLEKYDPFKNLQFVHDALSRVFDDSPQHLDATRGGTWVPPVDVYEDPERLTFRFDVPGVKKEDVHVRVENSVLTVEGKRVFESEQKRQNYHRIERSFGQFARSFSLPSTVSQERVEADLRDGVLNITLSKKPEAQPRTIEIK